jgi:hypothetical protein
MKRKLFLVAGLAMLSPFFTNAQWGGSVLLTGDTYRTGRVGIGTTTPVTQLNVISASTNDGVRIQQTGTTAASLGLFNNSGRNWALFSTGTGNSEGAGNLGIYDYSGGGYRMFIQGSTGNTGFGTLTPLFKMHVNDGGLMISGSTPGFGGPQLIFSDNATSTPNGRWAIEYLTADPSRPSMGGLHFWKPFPDAGGAGNYSMFLKDDGKIGMGVTDDNTHGSYCATAFPSGYRLYVNGGILTTKVKVANYCSANWADYVFADDYHLKPLSEVEAYINANNHLPNIPSAQAIEDEGLDLAEIASKQMEKIEELTLYLIQMEKDLKQLKAENAIMKAQVQSVIKD